MAMTDSGPLIELQEAMLELPLRDRSVGTVPVGQGGVGGALVKRNGRVRQVRVLDGVSFRVEPGMSLGIIGLNGSGKSSLLRLIAGIYQPSSGLCRVRGKVTTLFSNQLGMVPNATGAENVRILALLLGLRDESIDDLVKDVAEFSELGEYMNVPIRAYSAGMRTRIGFGVVTSGKPEVLLIDEVFGTGDHSFMAKARARMQQLIGRAGVVILASHSVELLRQYSSHLLWLNRGKVVAFGETDVVLREYRAA
jgi:ABC-type polysaccharide/polyol phosphate transport system ATPase subunit